MPGISLVPLYNERMPPVVYHPDYCIDIGTHVFPSIKYARVHDGLTAAYPDFSASVHTPQPATREQLLRVHTDDYLSDLEACRMTARTRASELPISEDIVRGFILMAGGSCLAARLAMQHGCAMNIGGGFHHAFADRAEGFCYINDIAVAIRDVMHDARIQRAAVVDTDLHQGNGTARIFLDDPRVFTCSIHQQNNYPVKERSDLDIGLPDGIADEAYLDALQGALQATLLSNPQLVVYVGGVDPYEQDQLGGLDLSLQGVKQRDKLCFEACRDHGVPVCAVFAGGYARRVKDTFQMHLNTYVAMREVFSDGAS